MPTGRMNDLCCEEFTPVPLSFVIIPSRSSILRTHQASPSYAPPVACLVIAFLKRGNETASNSKGCTVPRHSLPCLHRHAWTGEVRLATCAMLSEPLPRR